MSIVFLRSHPVALGLACMRKHKHTCIHTHTRRMITTRRAIRRFFLMYVFAAIAVPLLLNCGALSHLLSCFVVAIIVSPSSLPLFRLSPPDPPISISSSHFLSPCLVRSNSICTEPADTLHKLINKITNK